MFITRSLFRTLLLLVPLTLLVGCDSGGKRIVLLTNGDSPYWDACRTGMQDGAKEFKFTDAGFKADMQVNDGTTKGQIDKLRQLGNQSDVVGVAISPLEADNAAVADELKALQKKGIAVICMDSDVNRDKFRDARSYYIGTDNLKGGKVLGKAAEKVLAAREVKSGEYVQFVGKTGAQNARERMDGFKEAVGKDYKEVDRMADDVYKKTARINVKNALVNHPDLVALVGIWSYNAPAIADVITENGVIGKMAIVTFDAEPKAIDEMGKGKIDVMVAQNPYQMGFESARLLKAMSEKDEAVIKKMFPEAGKNKETGDIFETELRVITKDQGSAVKEEEFKDQAKCMKLGEFKTWLAERKLSGS